MPEHQTITISTERSSRSMLRRVVDNIRGIWSGPLTSNSPELARLWSSPPTSTGVSVSQESALTYSAVWAAVSLISSQVASLPLVLYKRLPGGGKQRFDSHPLAWLLHDEPNPETTSFIFREALQAHALTWGNGYAEIERDQIGRPVALWLLTPDRVTPMRDRARGLFYHVTNLAGGTVDIAAHDMLHVPGLGFDGTMGYSVVAMARESIGLGIATERFGGAFFGNGSTFGGILKTPHRLTEQAKKGLRASVEAQHQGVSRAHRFMLLEDGMDYTSIGIPPDDAQFLETRKFQVTEVARWFNLPPHKLRDLDRATFSNIEQQTIEFVTDTLRPWLIRWEQEINRKLVMPLEQGIQFAEHKIDALLRGDSASRAAFYKEMFGVGAFSINQILELENMNPIGAVGDVHYVPGALVPAVAAPKAPDIPASNREDDAPTRVLPTPQVIAAQRALIVDAMGRMVRRETDRALRADTTPEKARTHVKAFYEGFEDIVMNAVTPAVRAYLAWSDAAQDAATFVRPLVRAHVADSQRQLLAVADAHIGPSPAFQADLQRLVQRWEADRVETFADLVIRQAPAVPVVRREPSPKIAEMQRRLDRLQLPSDAQLNREIARQKEQVEKMRARRLDREADGRLAKLLKK